MTQETIRIRQSSMQATDAPALFKSDARAAIPKWTTEYAPDMIGFTELNIAVKLAVRLRCRLSGYKLVTRSTVGIAVHPKHEIIELGGVDVLPGQSVGRGSFNDRGIVEATVRTPAGNIWTHHEAHWITGPDPSNTRRERMREQQSEAMAERVALHGRGRRISTWAGDTNEDEGRPEREVQTPMTRAGLISIYDALKKYPTTHGRTSTIDVIGHFKRDTRVTPISVQVGKRRNSDHREVDVVYKIRS